MTDLDKIYSRVPNFVLGFHGCEKNVGEAILRGEKDHLKKSNNSYDWLGKGVYFWENSPSRALDFAEQWKRIKEPFVIGVVLDLGYCLDFLDYENLQLLKESHTDFSDYWHEYFNDTPFPKNSGSMRNLDCAVIENIHNVIREREETSFDSTRGVFIEGAPLYPGCGFHEKNHIQLCIRNYKCIKGYFRPIEKLPR